MGREYASREKKLPMVNFLIFVHKNVYRIRFQKTKIGPLKGFKKKVILVSENDLERKRALTQNPLVVGF